ncbi:hypothetical protein DL93DRAFT_2230415 [Clavulina sp. PMI_390]|nr:hypothetical protein DL93DRAFT_2230415 [Clavulina sp. PMI_390]
MRTRSRSEDEPNGSGISYARSKYYMFSTAVEGTDGGHPESDEEELELPDTHEIEGIEDDSDEEDVEFEGTTANDEVEAPPPKRRKVTKSDIRSEEPADSQEACLRIPKPLSDSSKTLTITAGTTIGDLLPRIWLIIGCEHATEKPSLTYVIGKERASTAEDLASQDDLDEMIRRCGKREVQIRIQSEYKKKLKNAIAAKKNPGAKKTSTSRSGKSAAATAKQDGFMIVDPNASILDESSEDVESLEDREVVCWNALNKQLRSCHTCGNDRLCKLTADMKHVALTAQELSFWARAMAKDSSITLFTMPNDPMFDKWRVSAKKKRDSTKSSSHKRSLHRSSTRAPPSDSDHSSTYSRSRSHSRSYSRSRSGSHSPSRHYSRSRSHRRPHHPSSRSGPPISTQPLAASDEWDEEIDWPEIVDYLEDFNKKFSQQNRFINAENFMDNGIFSLIEMKDISISQLRQDPFYLTWGDANVLEADIKKTIRNLRERHAGHV